MIRYLISLVTFLICIVLTIFTSGGTVLPYVDIPSLIIVGIFPPLFVSIVFGFKKWFQHLQLPSKKNQKKANCLIR